MEQQLTGQRVGRMWPAHTRPSELDFILSATGNHGRCSHKGAIDSDCLTPNCEWSTPGRGVF